MISARLFLVFLTLCILLAACGDGSPTLANSPLPAAQPTKTITPGTAIAPAVTPTKISQPTPTPGVIPRSTQDENNIREALLQYRFVQNVVNLPYPVSLYCIGFETAPQSPGELIDVPQTFLDHLQGNNPPLVKASECAMDQQQQMVVSKTSGQKAILWGLGDIGWSGNDKASLELSYLYGFNGTGGTIFQLERQNGGWKVTGSVMTWIA